MSDASSYAHIFDDIAEGYGVRCELPVLHKYYLFANAKAEQRFFTQPTIRLTPREQLNDPFELSQRWDTLTSKPFREKFKTALLDDLHQRLSDPQRLLSSELARFNEERGTNFTMDELIAKFPDGIDQAVSFFRAQLDVYLPTLAEQFWAGMEGKIPEIMERVCRELGILSLCGEITNRAMWATYAGSGRGFALTFNVQHDFFLHEGKNRLHKVTYSDERIDGFFDNPYFMYLVKHTEFANEQEWRMCGSLAECQQVPLPNGGPLYLLPIQPGMIQSATFGYAVEQHRMEASVALLRSFDPAISMYRITPNHQTGRLEQIPLL